jgi:hypothetical protein
VGAGSSAHDAISGVMITTIPTSKTKISTFFIIYLP